MLLEAQSTFRQICRFPNLGFVVAALVASGGSAITGFGISCGSANIDALIQNLEFFKVLMPAVGNFTEFCKVCDSLSRVGIYNL